MDDQEQIRNKPTMDVLKYIVFRSGARHHLRLVVLFIYSTKLGSQPKPGVARAGPDQCKRVPMSSAQTRRTVRHSLQTASWSYCDGSGRRLGPLRGTRRHSRASSVEATPSTVRSAQCSPARISFLASKGYPLAPPATQ